MTGLRSSRGNSTRSYLKPQHSKPDLFIRSTFLLNKVCVRLCVYFSSLFLPFCLSYFLFPSFSLCFIIPSFASFLLLIYFPPLPSLFRRVHYLLRCSFVYAFVSLSLFFISVRPMDCHG